MAITFISQLSALSAESSASPTSKLNHFASLLSCEIESEPTISGDVPKVAKLPAAPVGVVASDPHLLNGYAYLPVYLTYAVASARSAYFSS